MVGRRREAELRSELKDARGGVRAGAACGGGGEGVVGKSRPAMWKASLRRM